VTEHYREVKRRREAGDEDALGFTLIELLIVIVIIAILAATVIFALGGVTKSSAQAACDSDAKSVEVAVEAYHAFPGNNDNWPTASASLTGSTNGGPYLRTYPTNTGHYTITIAANGEVDVTPAGATVPVNYDSSTDPCTAVK
jgi:prepilin-type N-terminal cleavage/methylation domain-containing protein